MDTEDTERIVRTTVPGEAEGIRLDLYLADRFTYRSRTAWQNSISAGEIRLNGRKTHASRLLHAGEVISLEMNMTTIEEPPCRTDFTVIAETKEFLVVNKPGDLPVHPSGRYFNHTLQRLLEPQYGKVFPVNRLDRETSGLTLFAKSGTAAARLSELFSTEKIAKTYYAIVFGQFPATMTATGFLSADPVSPIHKKRRFAETIPQDADPNDLQSCTTDFRLIRSENGFSLVECYPHTGRLHQIRATLYSMGFPLAGDKLYGPDDAIFLRFRDDAMTDADRDLLKMDRQALHAAKLDLISPFDGTALHYEAPLPDDFFLRP